MTSLKATNIAFVSIFTISLSLLSWTVYKAVSNPVEKENFFLKDYKTVERNYNKLIENENSFDKKINFQYTITKDKIIVSFKDKKLNKAITDLKIKALLTRPHTNKENTYLNISKDNNNYILNKVKSNLGKYRVILEIQESNKDNKNITIYKNIVYTN